MLSNHDYDCTPPRNINDLELHLDINELPQSHVATHFTDTSFLHISMQTFELRARLCSMTNSLRGGPEFEATLQHEDALQHCLDGIPHWTDSRSTQVRALLDLQLRQIIVVLHTPRALKPESRRKSDCRYAIIAALEAAASSIHIHSNLVEASNYSLCLTRNDYFRAALLICHVAYYARETKGTTSLHKIKMLAHISRLSNDADCQDNLRRYVAQGPSPSRNTSHAARARKRVLLVHQCCNQPSWRAVRSLPVRHLESPSC
jgi:hypothetical protein